MNGLKIRIVRLSPHSEKFKASGMEKLTTPEATFTQKWHQFRQLKMRPPGGAFAVVSSICNVISTSNNITNIIVIKYWVGIFNPGHISQIYETGVSQFFSDKIKQWLVR